MFQSIRCATRSLSILTISAAIAGAQRGSTPVSVVSVVAVRANGDSITGDGVVVGASNQVVTELTMLQDVSGIVVRNAAGAPIRATLIASDTVSGLALLQAPGLSAVPVRLATHPAARNDAVVVATLAPESDSAVTLLRTRITRVEAFANGTSLASLSETIEQNRTGAPVLNAAGELAGIAFVSNTGGTDHTFVIPSKYVERLAISSSGARPAATIASGARATVPTAAPPPAPAPTQAGKPTLTKQASPATSANRPFTASGLRNEKDYLHIYAGEFDRVSDRPESMRFATIFQAYVEACSSNCGEMLGDSAVEQMKTVCKDQQSHLVYNAFTKLWESQDYCAEYGRVGTGIREKPSMARAQQHTGPQTLGGAMEAMTSIMTPGSNGVGSAMAMIETVAATDEDLVALVKANGCGSAALNRFEENLRRYATSEAPIALAAGETFVRPVEVTIVSANYTRLLDDLIAKNSALWLVNRYNPGSVRDARVQSRDDQGRPTIVTASYLFHSTAERSYPGSVRLAFADGVPTCLYFFDSPNDCRTPSTEVVAAYRRGAYAP